MKKISIISFFIVCMGISKLALGQDLEKCSAILQNDTLIIKNGLVFQKFLWNNGNIKRLAFGEESTMQSIIAADKQPVFLNSISGISGEDKGSLRVNEMPLTSITTSYLRVEVQCFSESLEILRVFRLIPMCPAIPCEIYLKGEANTDQNKLLNPGDLKNIENDAARKQGEPTVPIIDRILLNGSHWKARSVEFFDITDRNNTLIQTYDRLAYRQECQLRGNLLLLENGVTEQHLFILKEAPSSSVQLNYPGFDFSITQSEVRVAGLGLNDSDINDSTWVKAYNTVLGLSVSNDELGILKALRQYQQTIRIHQKGRDNMILMNTWGDRSQDSRLNEKFALAELEAGARLGISHFQLDDGWQTGKSGNSAFKGGTFEGIWRNPDYWKPDAQRFPNGLTPIVKRGNELGIQICIWYNPSNENSLANWEKDAGVLIGLYKDYGIRTFKIDGVNLPDKISEINFRKMCDKVVAETNNNVVFNLDVTASRRGGYNMFNEYGNLFVENRYSDWKNYYPFWTLRNLWMLSKYVPAQNLQIEFLNIWRNQDKYANDPFGPVNYSFDYVFAISMMAQPLAWFEGTGLPEEAFKTSDLIKKYKSIQTEIHDGIILPIGEEPDGKCWTGFQSIQGENGFLLVFRELNDQNSQNVKTWLKPGINVKCTPVFGEGKAFTAKTGPDGSLTITLAKPNSYVLYKYTTL